MIKPNIFVRGSFYHIAANTLEFPPLHTKTIQRTPKAFSWSRGVQSLVICGGGISQILKMFPFLNSVTQKTWVYMPHTWQVSILTFLSGGAKLPEL